MARDFIPEREAELLDWSRNFREQIVARPVELGLSAEQAAAYALLDDAYAQEYMLSQTPSTRTPVQIRRKNEAKKALKADARRLARIIRATPGVTNDQRGGLGLTVPDADMTPAARPSAPPVVSLMPSVGRTVRVRLRDKASPTRRGKPPGTAGAAVLSYVGEHPSDRRSDWSFEGNHTRPIVSINFGPDIPAGAKVWIAAQWYNTRGQTGPMSAAVNVRMQNGVTQLQAAA